MNERFKYQSEIDELVKEGAEMPSNLVPPEEIQSYRYVFDKEHPHNHIPVYLINPKRMLQHRKSDKLTCWGYSLSCFADKEFAIEKFNKISKHNKNFWKTVGNCICSGAIQNSFGLISKPVYTPHFVLFEFEGCDLSPHFEIIVSLI